ncbi:TcpD family membrane protein [Bacillus paralicheniformis]|nr:TcpD family membrane protein [Bacillus paralicheniformis]MEC1052519.1 TcpD family membrane protein [Bacillus paralicheniformis]MEC1139383.1 TcpD family membrane protein [Bacillus paralicheniformis]MEC1236307.1 TcpD family membrane protein [Bacillus paralicheniformis]MEC1293357.1 TcpD family membrane protein [Bacillus paralicheniformis]MEC1298240.1 TcpD family membrane protein [Bacillus paralicheniformis]
MMNFFANPVLAASLPSLGNLTNWIQTEGGNAVAIVLVCFGIYYLFRQDFPKLIGFVIVAGFVFFAVGNPERLLKQLGELATTVFGG